MCAFFFASFLFCSFLLFFALSSTHSFLCQKRATRVLRFCGRQAKRRGMVEAELYGRDVLLVVHPLRRRCESKVVASGTSPRPLTAACPLLLWQACFMLYAAHNVWAPTPTPTAAQAFGLSLGSDSGSGFRFRVCGLSLLWTETGMETGTGTGPEMETGLCGPGVLPGQPLLRLRFIYGPRLLGNILIPRVRCQLSFPLSLSHSLSV